MAAAPMTRATPVSGTQISYLALMAGCGIILLSSDAVAVPLSITQTQAMSFGNLAVPGGPKIVTMDGGGNITAGSQWVLGGTQQEGTYVVGGDPGLIDISVGVVNTCHASVNAYGFTGVFGTGMNPLNNIQVTPASNIQLGSGNGDTISLGATISFNATTPAGICNIDFDLIVDYH